MSVLYCAVPEFMVVPQQASRLRGHTDLLLAQFRSAVISSGWCPFNSLRDHLEGTPSQIVSATFSCPQNSGLEVDLLCIAC